MKPTAYQICVQGRSTGRLAAALEGMTLHAGGVDTVFTGQVKDQSQLYGLLNRLQDLGLELDQRAAAARGRSRYRRKSDARWPTNGSFTVNEFRNRDGGNRFIIQQVDVENCFPRGSNVTRSSA